MSKQNGNKGRVSHRPISPIESGPRPIMTAQGRNPVIDSSARLISVWRSKILSVATARYRAAHAGSGPSNAKRLLAAQRPLPSPVTKMRISV